MKTIIEIHALQNFAPSNLNRDDTGAPKDAFFGGTRRARISSQCIKRAVRDYFKKKNSDYTASRTKRIADVLYKRVSHGLKDTPGNNGEKLSKAVEAAICSLGSKKKIKVGKESKTDVLLFLITKEIDALAQEIITSYADLLKSKPSDQVVKRLNNAIDGENKLRLSVDIALFGRMLAVMPEKNQNAACQVAHAISTHAVEREFDYYTAVDDLKPDETPGADMIGTVEFNSACFYRYAVVDWESFLNNLQQDRALAEKGLHAFLEGFVAAEPTGKQNTFAAHNPPEFVAVSVRQNGAPRNLANAYETALRVRKGESLTTKSAEALVKKAAALECAYGGEGKTFVLNICNAGLNGFGTKVKTLDDLLSKTIDAVKE